MSERLVDLRGMLPGDATRLIIDLARQLGYTAGASAPGTYRLARTRRRLVGKHVDELVVTVFEDRSGTRARFVGDVDAVLIEHLAPHAADAAIPVAQTPLVAPVPAPYENTLPQPVHRPSSAVAPTAVIGAVPGVVSAVPLASDPWEQSEVDGRTMVRPHAESPRPSLVLPDGRRVGLTGTVVIGREPDADRAPGAVTVAVGDRSLSKTHASVAVDAGVVTVVDLHSTNGTSIRVGGSLVACAPGQPTPVPPGAAIVAGAVVLEVNRA